MTTLSQERDPGGAIEVHGFSCESRTLMLQRLRIALAASGCWLIGTRYSRGSVEYSFEIELGAVLDLYCGLVHAGLQMTELTHHTLTELCVLRTHGQALNAHRRVLRVRLLMSFVQAEEEIYVPEVMAASA
jgi:hypothetical protein